MSQKRNSDFSFASERWEKTRYSGFTLVEMLVVVAIIISITGIVVNGQDSFNKTIILSNTAYDIALSLRSAESYGLGGRALGSLATGYGIHISKAASTKSYLLFADTSPAPSTSSVCHPTADATALDAQPGNCAYDAGQDSVITNYTLGNNITVSDFCAYAGTWTCANSGGSNLSSLDIVFARPNPVPLMSAGIGGSPAVYSSVTPVTKACIVIASPQGGLKYITVGLSGAINPNDTPCP